MAGWAIKQPLDWQTGYVKCVPESAGSRLARPRIDARSVDFSAMAEQWGDEPRPVMSLMGDRTIHPEQRCCWITETNIKTHDIIRSGLDRSPLFSGSIEGSGPVTARVSKTKFIVLLINPRIRFL